MDTYPAVEPDSFGTGWCHRLRPLAGRSAEPRCWKWCWSWPRWWRRRSRPCGRCSRNGWSFSGSLRRVLFVVLCWVPSKSRRHESSNAWKIASVKSLVTNQPWARSTPMGLWWKLSWDEFRSTRGAVLISLVEKFQDWGPRGTTRKIEKAEENRDFLESLTIKGSLGSSASSIHIAHGCHPQFVENTKVKDALPLFKKMQLLCQTDFSKILKL